MAAKISKIEELRRQVAEWADYLERTEEILRLRNAPQPTLDGMHRVTLAIADLEHQIDNLERTITA